MPFVDLPSVMITIGGSIAAILINFPMGKVLSVFSVVKKCFMTSLPTPREVIDQFKKFATTARRDGLLALENDMADVSDVFLTKSYARTIAVET